MLKSKRGAIPVYDQYDVERGVELSALEQSMAQDAASGVFGRPGVDWSETSSTKQPKYVMSESEHGSEKLGLLVRQEGEYGSMEVAMTQRMGRPVYLTANIPECANLAYNEAYLDNEDKKMKSDFIKHNQLGTVLPMSKSGAKGYNKVIFDMDKLAEFDPIGVEEYMQQMEIEGRLPRQVELNSPEIDADMNITHRALPSVAYDMGLADYEMAMGDSQRALPSMGEELLAQTQAGYQSEIGPEY